jgi:F-type H+-transporting ATPase subunit delta
MISADFRKKRPGKWPKIEMKINKEIRQVSKALLRASFTDGQLDRGKIGSLVESLITKKPRHHLDILENYKRLLRLELDKRHARVESADKLTPDVTATIIQNLGRKYGNDLTTEFVVDPTLLGGMRVRVGSDVWDGTVKNRLERLANQL